MSDHALQKLGRYLVSTEIAQGGMAIIYRGKLLGIEGFSKDVAIKKILPFWSQNAEFITMLIDEAKILVQLQHPNIVQVFELGKDHDTYFIVMEYVHGFDLRTLIKHLQNRDLKLPHALVACIIKQICLGLDFAHHKTDNEHHPLHIVHRDISPQNILIGSEGEVKITDFGIAKTTQKNTQTQAGVVKGKFSYMSPEQALGEDIDHATDIFALGILLYEMIVGKKCFDGRNDFEIIEKVKKSEVQLDDTLDDELKRIILTALSPVKANRYATALDFYNDIEKWEASFSKRAFARDLKTFLWENFAELLRKKNEPVAPAKSEEATLAQPSSKSDGYTVITQATALWDKTIIEVQNQKQSDSPSQKTRIFSADQDPSGSHSNSAWQKSTSSLSATSQKNRISNEKKSWMRFLIWTVPILPILLIWFFKTDTPPIEPVTVPAVSAPETEAPSTETQPSADVLTPALTEPPATETVQPVIEPAPTQPAVFHGSLVIRSEPADAKITATIANQVLTANGVLEHKFDFTEDKITIPIEIEKSGYKKQTLSVDVFSQNPVVEKQIALTAFESGRLYVEARPWANFRVEGFSGKNYTTPNSVKITEGTYTLRIFTANPQKSVSKTIVIKPGQTLSCRATFAEKNSVGCSYY